MITDDEWFEALGPADKSIINIMSHIASIVDELGVEPDAFMVTVIDNRKLLVRNIRSELESKNEHVHSNE